MTSRHVAAALKAAGDSMRLEILKIMCRDSYGVLELCRIFAVQQPSMSHHLKVMVRAGLLASRREGNSIFYRRVQNAEPSMQAVLDHIYEIADDTCSAESVAERVVEVQRNRKTRSRQFFEENVARFKEQQDLIAGFDDYGEAVQDLMCSGSDKSWLEVGPGAGELLEAREANFGAVTALDISEQMLEQSRQRIGETKVNFVLGDSRDLVQKRLRVDCITCNMVLHHVASPASMVSDLAELLNPEGQLLLCDLDVHDQEWAQTSCGDLWLGFSPDQVTGWAQDACLLDGRAQYLALRNGFRVQIREFRQASGEGA